MLPFQKAGLSLIEVLVVIALIAILIPVALLTLSQARMKASRITCVNQLKNIGLAYRIFATDHNDEFPFQVAAIEGGTLEFENDIVRQFFALTNELSNPYILVCINRTFGRPRGAEWNATAATNWSTLKPTNIDYFLNLNATEAAPDRILAGDNCVRINGQFRHGLTSVTTNDVLIFPNPIHSWRSAEFGNAVFGDGSVRQFHSADWPSVLAQTALPTNRFLFP